MSRRSCHNPVLETKRDAFLAEEQAIRDSSQKTYNESVSNTKNVHSSFLFTTENGIEIIRSICLAVSPVKANVNNNSWKDLAAKLGFNDSQIKSAENLAGQVYDTTEQTIKFYANRNGSVGDLLQALLDTGFQSALRGAQEHIDGFLAEVKAVIANGISVKIVTEDGVDMVKAANFNPHVPIIFAPLPSETKAISTLNNSFDSGIEEEALQMSRPQQPRVMPPKKKKYCKGVMISFASDGHATAKRMAQVLRATKNSRGQSIGVVILSENAEAVHENPMDIRTKVLPEVDFVIPVLTEGYFNALQNPNPCARLLDERYIQFVHNIMSSKLIYDQCRNLNVRPLIPKQEFQNIYKKKEFIFDPILKPYTIDDDMESLAVTILKARKEKMFK